jgi:hypothetical protein
MIFLAREGSQLGTFAPDEVREGLRRGRFAPTDLYFAEGMADWRPLGEWEGASAAPPQGAPERPAAGRSLKGPVLVGCAAVALVAFTIAGGVAVFSLLRPSRPSEPFPQTLALFRTGMLHDWKGTIHRYAEEGVRRQFADLSVDLWRPVAPDVGWSYWFNTAVFTGTDLASAKPRTAFYHPWSDTFWLAEWDLRSKPRVTKSWFGAGDVLRSGGKPPWNPIPLWLRGGGSRADAFARALAESIPAAERALERRSWPDGATREDPLRGVNANLCRTTLIELIAGIDPLWQPLDGEDAALARLRAEILALRRARPARVVASLRDAPENTEATRRALAAFPSALAESLQPVCRLGAGRTAVVVLMPSQAADVALATVWDASATGARLLRVDVLPFAELLKAARASREGRP